MEILFPVIVGLLAVGGVGIVFAYTRSATVDSAGLTKKLITIESSLSPAEVFERLESGVGKFALEDADRARGLVVLTTKPTFATWGFFYPVHLAQSGDGSTVTVGIRSRLVQFGPLVGLAHRQCATAIKQQLAG